MRRVSLVRSIVVSGRIGGKTDTMPLRVEKLIQEYDEPAAYAVASVLTALSLATLGPKSAGRAQAAGEEVGHIHRIA